MFQGVSIVALADTSVGLVTDQMSCGHVLVQLTS